MWNGASWVSLSASTFYLVWGIVLVMEDIPGMRTSLDRQEAFCHGAKLG